MLGTGFDCGAAVRGGVTDCCGEEDVAVVTDGLGDGVCEEAQQAPETASESMRAVLMLSVEILTRSRISNLGRLCGGGMREKRMA